MKTCLYKTGVRSKQLPSTRMRVTVTEVSLTVSTLETLVHIYKKDAHEFMYSKVYIIIFLKRFMSTECTAFGW